MAQSSSTPRPSKGWFTPRGRVLRAWVRVHLWLYRRSRGKVLYRMRGMPTLLLTTTGRRSGNRHTVPLPYLVDPVASDPAGGDAKVVVGSFAGGPRDPAPGAGRCGRQGRPYGRKSVHVGFDLWGMAAWSA